MQRSKDSYDVIVAGGGIAGSMAAIAAAAEGCRTLLIERYTALGGMATLGLVQPISMWGKRKQYVIGGRGRKMLEDLHGVNEDAATAMSYYGPTCDAEHLKKLLETRALEEGVELLYHTWIMEAERDSDRIAGLRAVSKAGTMELFARIVIDATGDADVAAAGGVPFDEDSQGMTLMFILSGIDRENCPSKDEMKEIWENNKVGYRKLALFWHPRGDSVYMNVTELEGLSGLNPWDLTQCTIECRKQAWRILEVMQKHMPGFENAYISQTAPALGVRESRRIRGRYILTKDDVLSGADFRDTIARAGCPVDVHGSKNGGVGEYGSVNRSYGIPYRCLTVDSVRNLIVTGRPISADHIAHSSLRRMAPGFALGEAAGVAAAMAVREGDATKLPVDELRSMLQGYGAVLHPERI